MTWTPERTETLERLWEAGATFAELARHLQVPVNAIKGKTDRLNLKRGEHRRIEALKAWHGRRRISKLKLHVASTTFLSRSVEAVCEPIYTPGPMARTLDLNTGCAFPVGHATGADQLYCGEPTFGRRRYCPMCERRMRGQS